jgi:hypothetical protein
MELGWGALALIIIGAAVAWFWQDSLGARERANAAATQACHDLSLQFLDGTVAFARIVLARAADSRIALRRTYVFDYTANSIERRQGFVVLIGHRIESVGYAPDIPLRPAELDISRPEPPQQDAANTSDSDSRVLKLEDWRARRRRSGAPPSRWHEDRGDRRN